MRTTLDFNSSINYRKSKKWTTELQYWFSSLGLELYIKGLQVINVGGEMVIIIVH